MRSSGEMLIPVLLALSLHLASAEVTIDLATAMFDENLQQFCVMQKVGWDLEGQGGDKSEPD